MSFFRQFKKFVSLLSILSIFGLSIAPAQAAMVTNDQLIAKTEQQVTTERLLTQLDRQDVKNMLVSMGVNPVDAKARINQLNETELAQLQNEFDQLPAGSGVLGAILVVFVVLVITDMLGATNVFGFVHNINH